MVVQDRSAMFLWLCGPGVGAGGPLNKAQYTVTGLKEPKLVNSRLPKNKTGYIIDDFEKDQMNMLRSLKKLNFCSTFKIDVSRLEYLDLIENEKHSQAVVKLLSGDHRLRIETDRYHLSPKIPENLN